MGLTMIALVLLMTTVEIDGGNRYQSITSHHHMLQKRRCHLLPPLTTESPTPAPSSAESPLTVSLIAPPLQQKSHYVQYHSWGGSIQSESRVGGITSENRGGAIQSEVTAERPAP
ncbi:hypothetical protein AgCh_028632 [Apium graveolens]